MDDVLLSYYNRELHYLRKSGAEFSEKYPKIAGRLRLDKDIVEDPHVSRLIESFAFLTARIRHTIDDSFPELTEALMGVLYPDYHAPIPSTSIVQLTSLPHLQQKVSVSRQTPLRISDDCNGHCFYHTTTEVNVLPINITKANLYSLPVKAPTLPASMQEGKAVQSILKITVKPQDIQNGFDFNQDNLRFYINSQPAIAFKLFELLLNSNMGICIARDAFDDNPHFISADALSNCGFGDEENIIEFDGRESKAHRLFVEYFSLPQKFLFIELKKLSGLWQRYKTGFDIYIYLSDSNNDLVNTVGERTFLLGCTPVVNLFEAVSEPIQASELGGEVMLRVANQKTQYADIYRIKDVYAVNPQGERKVLLPFYGNHFQQDEDAIYWTVRREHSNWQKGRMSRGMDIYLSFVDCHYQVVKPDSDWIINANLICTNRDLPNTLPFGPDQPQVQFIEGGASLRAKCLLPPASTVIPELGEASRWQLVSQLSLQHLSQDDGLLKLKESLALYNFSGSKEVIALLEGMVNLQTEIITARILVQGRSALCQGTHFILTCNENAYTGNGLYLFGLILDEFLSQSCTINTFTQLSIKTTKYSRLLFSWSPRVGCQPLV